jgi:hypothetical protein
MFARIGIMRRFDGAILEDGLVLDFLAAFGIVDSCASGQSRAEVSASPRLANLIYSKHMKVN